MPRISACKFRRTFVLLNLRTAAQVVVAKRYAAPSRWTQTKLSDTHRPNKSKKQTSVGHHSAQTHLPRQLFVSLFFAQTTHRPHRQITKTILFQKATALKADARFLLKVLV